MKIYRFLVLIFILPFLLGNFKDFGLENLSKSSPPINGKWKLIFNDDFNDLDSRFWSSGTGNKSMLSLKNEHHFLNENLLFSDGKLNLIINYKPRFYERLKKEYPYASAAINSKSKLDFKYGYIEVAVKTPEADGINTALWLMESRSLNENTEKIRFEIDIFEQLSKWGYKKFSNSVHQYMADGSRKHVHFHQYKVPKIKKGDYTRLGLLWEADRLIWFTNGKKVSEYVFDENAVDNPMYIILSLETGSWAGKAEIKDLPDMASFDYLRIWQRL